VKAVTLVCPRCTSKLLVSPGVSLGVCNPCSTAYDFSSGEKRPIPVEEAVGGAQEEGAPAVRLPFLRFEASARSGSAAVFVMAFALRKIGTPHDDGSKMTVDGFDRATRPGSVDAPPEIAVATAAGLARFLALRRLDPDGRLGLVPEAVRLGNPAVLSVPFVPRGERLFNPFTGLAQERGDVRL